MYSRITNEHDLCKLRAGDLLIQYPLSGNSKHIDLSVPERFCLYEVESVEADNVRLLLRSDILHSYPSASSKAAAQDLSTFVIKHNENLLREENWWQKPVSGPLNSNRC